MSRRYLCGALVGVLATAGALTTAFGASAAPASSHAQAAKPSVMRPLGFKPVQRSKPARPRRTNNLAYRGGVGGIGVETAPTVYLVLWGSQWSSDPSHESTVLQNFLPDAGGSSWLEQRHAVLPGRRGRHDHVRLVGPARREPAGDLRGY